MRIGLDIPPGIVGDDTTYSASGRWADGSNVRFRLGRPQVIGGWESLTTSLLTGVCRNAFPWTDNTGSLYVGFGTHSNLEVCQDSTLYDVTPTLAMPSVTLGANPLATTNLSTTVVVSLPGHGLAVADTFVMAGATNTGGIVAANLNGTRAVTAVTTNTVSFTAGAGATSTATGGGSAVTLAPQVAYTAGQIDGTGGSGYGTGAYGVGTYSSPSTTDYFPRTWGLGAWGQNLLANPRMGPIYTWNNVTATPAAPLANSPRQVSHMVVAPNEGGYQVFAIGCNEEASGVFNPMCIRHSSVRDNTEWNTTDATTAREYILVGGGRLVAGRMCGDFLLVWTNYSLFVGEFIGDLEQPWRFTEVAVGCGLIGPNAVVVVGQTAYWVSPDRQFHRYALGTSPLPIDCQVRDEFADNLSPSQGDKIIASANAEFSEVRFDYPDVRDGSGYENSRYLALCLAGPEAGSWYKGEMARTAFVDAGPSQYPIGVTYGGNIYYHERGNSADGGMFSWFIRTADLYLDENFVMEAQGVWPDFINQQGPVNIEVTGRLFLQDDEVTTGLLPMGVGQQKVDFQITGRVFQIEFSGNSVPTEMRLGRFEVDVKKKGLR